MRIMKQLKIFIDKPTQNNWEKIPFTSDGCYISIEAGCCHECPFDNEESCKAVKSGLDIGKRLALSIELLAKLQVVWGEDG